MIAVIIILSLLLYSASGTVWWLFALGRKARKSNAIESIFDIIFYPTIVIVLFIIWIINIKWRW